MNFYTCLPSCAGQAGHGDLCGAELQWCGPGRKLPVQETQEMGTWPRSPNGFSTYYLLGVAGLPGAEAHTVKLQHEVMSRRMPVHLFSWFSYFRLRNEVLPRDVSPRERAQDSSAHHLSTSALPLPLSCSCHSRAGPLCPGRSSSPCS